MFATETNTIRTSNRLSFIVNGKWWRNDVVINFRIFSWIKKMQCLFSLWLLKQLKLIKRPKHSLMSNEIIHFALMMEMHSLPFPYTLNHCVAGCEKLNDINIHSHYYCCALKFCTKLKLITLHVCDMMKRWKKNYHVFKLQTVTPQNVITESTNECILHALMIALYLVDDEVIHVPHAISTQMGGGKGGGELGKFICHYATTNNTQHKWRPHSTLCENQYVHFIVNFVQTFFFFCFFHLFCNNLMTSWHLNYAQNESIMK